ncbi:hypothetical protein GE061_000239 [Apolygus lucorum]|uniref:Laminin EGF-like domain-containing protein n=1 Tax=Apolygus lucorum TaxID=248454 RepID=A0A6A4IVX1_APOLU|nr:hypothetical protein GE061_000239 [Apolygus lucorum]
MTFLRQATSSIDSLSSTELRCTGLQDTTECTEIEKLLSGEVTIYHQIRENFILELINIQSKIQSVSSKVDKLKQGTIESINRSIKEYTCCLKSLNFAIDDIDCNDVTSVYPTELDSECGCDPLGSYGPTCTADGSCSCRPQFEGKLCDRCKTGFYNHPLCAECACDPLGSSTQTCNSEGECSCKGGVEGVKCDRCQDGLVNFPYCEEALATTEAEMDTPTPWVHPRDRCVSDRVHGDVFSCHHDGGQQVPCRFVCDGDRDCPNGRDESVCHQG